MVGRINQFIREYIYFISIIVTIIGVGVLIIGLLGMFTRILIDSNIFTEDIANWSLYILIIGFILLLTGLYYFYSFITKKRFVLRELTTNKRSEFVKKHHEVQNAVKFLPRKYHKLLIEKEKELKIK
jgi:hypothetical protein